MSGPVRVGLVGAGPWADMVHAPVFAAGPETTLTAVWARRPAAAATLAGKHGAEPVATLEELFAACDAVAFCVPPEVQCDIAVQAARAGRALILEKPIAHTLDAAVRLADVIDTTGVPSAVLLTWRYARKVRDFIGEAEQFVALGARATFLGGGLLAGPFRTPWRLASGPLLDLGPHVIDLATACLGPVTAVRAAGELSRWVALTLEHEGGVVSQAAMSGHVAVPARQAGIEVYGEAGHLVLDCAGLGTTETFATFRAEVAEMVRSGRPHAIDAAHGLELQRVIEEATRQLA